MDGVIKLFLSLLLYEVVCGKLPFDFNSDREKEILALPFSLEFIFITRFDRLSPGVRDLIKRCLTLRAEDRINVNDILRHPWMTWMDTMEPSLYNFRRMIGYEPSPAYLNASPAPVIMPPSQHQQYPLGLGMSLT